MAKSTAKKPGVIKVAEKIGTIAGTIVGKKNQLIKKAGEAIETVKSKVQDLTGKKEQAKKVVKKAAKKTATKVKKAAKKTATKVKKAAKKTAKKVKKTATKVKKTARKN